ncbi:hypothetical protein CF327_g3649 [Tilletia walkeri]|uniref:Aprataxin C2HE/C2H2/C2HC zinc finger domain-containing protein n=1 Tax=Tilletia walkeri TaxID=117179 RepID=A0A8X7NEW3_9BASI|nr:hypothetical protein CF327_g3649 [Tilletia walkeri]KAE8270745.1 hypothetical protein A4X09_0g1607 [Tilletia walkeri]
MTKDPVPANVPKETRLVMHDQHTITIQDKWPKSSFHLLVLRKRSLSFQRSPFARNIKDFEPNDSLCALPRTARIPFPLRLEEGKQEDKAKGKDKEKESPPKLSLAGGKFLSGTTSGNSVPASHLQDVSTLLASPYAAQVLAALRTASDRAIDWIHEQMLQLPLPGSSQKCYVTWTVERAFHAIPSMQTVHLHVYSNDLVSAPLKNAKHYNSFSPSNGFALSLADIEALVEQGKKTLPHPTSHYAGLLKAPLVGRDGQRYRNIPQLKTHLEEYWRAEIAAEKTKKKKRRVDADPVQEEGSTEVGSSASIASPSEERETKKRRTSPQATSNDT